MALCPRRPRLVPPDRRHRRRELAEIRQISAQGLLSRLHCSLFEERPAELDVPRRRPPQHHRWSSAAPENGVLNLVKFSPGPVLYLELFCRDGSDVRRSVPLSCALHSGSIFILFFMIFLLFFLGG